MFGGLVSRGFGPFQRLIVDELEALPEGFGVQLTVTGDSPVTSSSIRRAARLLELRGVVRLSSRLIDGRWHLVAHRT